MGERKHTKVEVALRFLLSGPKTGAEIADAIDEITPYVARSMAKQRELGRVMNHRAGLGGKALYAITEAGRAAIAKAEGQ